MNETEAPAGEAPADEQEPPAFRIMIADDVPYMRRLLASYLGDLGFRAIDQASDGEQVLAAFAEVPYDLAFVDIEMPGLGGLDALPQLLTLVPAAKVVMVSTQGTVDNVRAAVARGACGFLVKPYTKQKLEEVVRRVVPRQHRS